LGSYSTGEGERGVRLPIPNPVCRRRTNNNESVGKKKGKESRGKIGQAPSREKKINARTQRKETSSNQQGDERSQAVYSKRKKLI